MNKSHPSVNEWDSIDPEPTDFIVLWPQKSPPSLHEVCTALSRVTDKKILPLDTQETADSKLLWHSLLQTDIDDNPLVVWAEPMRPMAEEHVKFLGAENVNWTIGIETLLNCDDPLPHFASVLKTLATAFPDSPAILDVNKEGWHTRKELDEIIFVDDLEPQESILWLIHAVSSDPKPNEKSKSFVYTQGLNRCGRPELEMKDVPNHCVDAAIHTLNAVAELSLDEGLPSPGEPLEIGAGLQVTCQPSNKVAQFISSDSIGICDSTRDHNGTDIEGVRAVVCATKPDGIDRIQWVWPADVVTRLASGEATLYRSRRSTDRQAHLARRGWNHLLEVFPTIAETNLIEQNGHNAILIKASFNAFEMNDGFDREHLWFKATSIEPTRVKAQLLHNPHAVRNLNMGDVVWITREQVSDWLVALRGIEYTPNNTVALRDAIQKESSRLA